MTLPNAIPLTANQNGHTNGGPNEQEPTKAVVADTDALTQALRQSFQATVEEAVPDSLMDLINKLK